MGGGRHHSLPVSRFENHVSSCSSSMFRTESSRQADLGENTVRSRLQKESPGGSGPGSLLHGRHQQPTNSQQQQLHGQQQPKKQQQQQQQQQSKWVTLHAKLARFGVVFPLLSHCCFLSERERETVAYFSIFFWVRSSLFLWLSSQISHLVKRGFCSQLVG